MSITNCQAYHAAQWLRKYDKVTPRDQYNPWGDGLDQLEGFDALATAQADPDFRSDIAVFEDGSMLYLKYKEVEVMFVPGQRQDNGAYLTLDKKSDILTTWG